MRAGIIAAAFAATALAVPMEKKRAVVTNTDVEVVYVTEYYTVTGGNAAPTKEAAAPQDYGNQHWGHKPHWWGGKPNKGHTRQPKPTTAPAETASWEPAPTKSKTKTQQPQPTQSSAPPASGYSGVVIQQHNFHRANHSAPNIKWDNTLAANAAKVAASCVYAHNTDIGGIPQGQNIAAGVDADSVDRIITNMFYNGEVGYYANYYGMDSPPMDLFEKWGHFSQIVWKNTDSVGCATQHCPNGLANVGSGVPPYFTVCNYSPPGNFANEYGENIGSPLDHPSVIIS